MLFQTVLLCVENTLLLTIAAAYIVHCPFNKVEESFNTQAVHDVINLFPASLPSKDEPFQEVAIRNYLPWDHMHFPGVVPRSFLGALAIGLPMKLANLFLDYSTLDENNDSDANDHNKTDADVTSQLILQIGSRFALACLLVLSLTCITRALHKRYGLSFRLCFWLVTISQFHYLFYAGRFLPNTFAAVLANMVFASWINRQYSKSIVYIAFCVVIFRFDTILLFGWLLFDAVFIRRHITLVRVFQIGIPAGLAALVTTFIVDSVFWTRPVWPELEGLYFNLWLNKSHEWGTQPYFWYIYGCIPRVLMAAAPFLLFAEHKITRDYMIPTLAFILTYSFLPHKELRFVLFVTPLLNICVTSGLLNIEGQLRKLFRNINSLKRALFGTLLCAMIAVNLLGCVMLSRVASHNYPGGQVALSLGMNDELIRAAHQAIKTNESTLIDPRSDVAVYINNLAAQTGFSRFLQVNGAYYAKTPHLDSDTFKKSYKLLYLIFEPKEISNFLKMYCPPEKNDPELLSQSVEKWSRKNTQIKCDLPNQEEMFCSMIDSARIFQGVNIGGLIRRLKGIHSLQSAVDSITESGFIRTRIALFTLRCSIDNRVQ